MSNPSSRTNDQMREAIRDMLDSYRLPDTRFVIELAELWLTVHPADDDEPITPEWVDSVWPDDLAEMLFWQPCEDAIIIMTRPGEMVLRCAKTRGEMRTFVHGMGIDMKGGE